MWGRRGQLLLIGGLGIAMTFVVLAVVLNTVIFTQNLATREAVDSRSPVEFTNAVDQGLGGAITEVNYWNATSYDALDDAFRRSVSTWAGNTTRLSASRSVAAHVALESTTNGTRILQSTNRPWTNESGTPSWTMATGIDRTRRFHANISHDSLTPHNDSGLKSSGVFRIEVSNSTETWTLFIYQDTESPDPNVVNATVIAPNTGKTTCSAAGENIDVDVTEATVEGDSCSFSFAENVSAPYNITVVHGDNASVRYTLVVDKPLSAFPESVDASYNETGASDPVTLPAIYDATVRVTYERSDVYFSRSITLAPEDVPVGERYNVSA